MFTLSVLFLVLAVVISTIFATPIVLDVGGIPLSPYTMACGGSDTFTATVPNGCPVDLSVFAVAFSGKAEMDVSLGGTKWDAVENHPTFGVAIANAAAGTYTVTITNDCKTVSAPSTFVLTAVCT